MEPWSIVAFFTDMSSGPTSLDRGDLWKVWLLFGVLFVAVLVSYWIGGDWRSKEKSPDKKS